MIKISIIFLLFVSCHSCINNTSAVVLKVENIITVSGKTARRGSKQKVFISYQVESKNYKKSFISSSRKYFNGESIQIKTAEDPNYFCVGK